MLITCGSERVNTTRDLTTTLRTMGLQRVHVYNKNLLYLMILNGEFLQLLL